MLKKILLPVLLAAAMALPAGAAEIIVLQSAALAPYNEALQGFVETVGRCVPTLGQKAVQAHALTTLVLTESPSPLQVRRSIIDAGPDLLVAIGSSSLSLVKDIGDIPVIYLMVPFPEAMALDAARITGVGMNISPARQLETLTLAAPRVKNIGLLFDPSRTKAQIDEAMQYAGRNHLNLIPLSVRAATEVPARLADLKGQIDWLWMLPDLTVLTPQSVDAILLFSLEEHVPIFTFARKYLDMGAVLAASVDNVDMGRQAGDMALKILRGTPVSDLAPEGPRTVVTEGNAKAAAILGVSLPESTQ